MDLQLYIQAHADDCRKRIQKLERSLQSFPEGSLHCYKNKNGYITKVSIQGKPDVYLPKDQRDKAEILARKAVREAQIRDLKHEQLACDRYLKTIERHPHAVEKLLARPGMRDLISKPSTSWDDYAKKWMNETYIKSSMYPEKLRVPTVTGEKVRSKSEAICIQILCDLEIPFRYEQQWIMNNISYYPDFTLLRPWDRRECLIELFGMMGDQKYIDHTYEKLAVYAKNGWIQDHNLFCFFETPDEPLDTWFLTQSLTHFLTEKFS